MASIQGTVSTILAATIMAPCSPCMNWLSWALSDSIPRAVISFSPQLLKGEPGTSRAALATATVLVGAAEVASKRSGSTSVAQSRSVTELHWESMALL